MSPRRSVVHTFQVLSAFAVLGAAYHVLSIIRPVTGGAPLWRHALFVVLDLGMAAGLLRRPRWFTLAFALMTAQQLFSHGGRAWRYWQDGRIDWLSIAVLLFMPVTLALLIWTAPHANMVKEERSES